MGKDMTYAERIVEIGKEIGADNTEAYVYWHKDLSIQIRSKEVESLKSAEERGVGIRILKDGKRGFAYTSDMKENSIKKTVQKALDNSQENEPDEALSFPLPAVEYPELDLYDPEIAQVSVDKKIEIAKEIEVKTLQQDKRIKQLERAVFEDREYRITIANGHGLAQSYHGSSCGAFAYAIGDQDGEQQTGFGMDYAKRFRDLNIDEVAKEAAWRATQLLGAKSHKSQKATIVFDPYIATSFLGLIAPGLSADAVQKGRSLFTGKMDQQVASLEFSLVDDGCLPQGIASAPFDDEGVPTSETILINDGKLNSYLYDTYTAKKEGTVSTGNGIRGSFKGGPHVGTTNLFIKPGKISRTELLGDIKNGFYVLEVMGMHTANPITGDFSLGAAGLWIEDGQLTYGVREVAIAGNILDLLQHIDGVADDLRFFGGTGSPTLRIAQMMVSGS